MSDAVTFKYEENRGKQIDTIPVVQEKNLAILDAVTFKYEENRGK